ncbi:hypothetical protein H5410_060683 [Solanum commersonii]|uniref:Uncharacterized protein n=1 Tax=Solanum commersonii TaxID=4109 RepID=A0A9J5W5Q5_SOLCO|nr:hypothetical protein H5410_060683 [Solanum commersonii]
MRVIVKGRKRTAFVFLKPKKTIENESAKTKNSSEEVKTAGKLKQTKTSTSGGEKGLPPAAAAQQAVYYVRNRADKEADKNKRKSYLPYRKELIGFFAIGLSKSYRPF